MESALKGLGNFAKLAQRKFPDFQPYINKRSTKYIVSSTSPILLDSGGKRLCLIKREVSRLCSSESSSLMTLLEIYSNFSNYNNLQQSVLFLSDLNSDSQSVIYLACRHILVTRLGDLGKPETSLETTSESEYKRNHQNCTRRTNAE